MRVPSTFGSRGRTIPWNPVIGSSGPPQPRYMFDRLVPGMVVKTAGGPYAVSKSPHLAVSTPVW